MVKDRWKKQTRFWFTIGVRLTSTVNIDDVVKEIEDNFTIKCKGYGTGKYHEAQADFFVGSQKKRTRVRQFIAQNIGCKFYIR